MPDIGAPSVTSIVLNYGTPNSTIHALESLVSQNYDGRHDVVAIDNMSPDDSRDILSENRPDNTELVLSDVNHGFGGGLNLLLEGLHTDYAFILNSDARCDGRDVIAKLVERAETRSSIGAVAPKIVFDERWIRVVVESEVHLPILHGEPDRRPLGVAVVGADVDGQQIKFDDLMFEAGFHNQEKASGMPYRRTLGKASLLVPVPREAESGIISLHLMTDVRTNVAVSTTDNAIECPMEATAVSLDFTRRQQKLTVKYGPDSEVLRINNTGSHLKGSFHGADRGFGSYSTGQFEQADPVFAFCGAAALLSRRSLEAVGLFDASYFLYYEDTELSWRMQTGGFEIWYEPDALVRHSLSGSTGGEASDLFKYHVWRNRLFMITVHAPPKDVLRATGGAVISFLRQLVRPWNSNARHNLTLRARVLASYIVTFPRLIRKRA